MKHLPLDALHSFVCVADHQSFTEAGRLMGRSQPAISLQIKKLESSLNVQLLTREGQSIALSASGRLLYDYARKMLQLNDLAIAQLSQQDIRGTITVGMPSEFASRLLPKVLGRFANDYPSVRLDAVCALSRELEANRHRAQYDVTLTLKHAEQGSHGPLGFSDQLVWVGSGKPVDLSQGVSLVLAPQGCIYREAALLALEAKGISVNISYTNADLSGLQAAVEQGLGITVLARSTVPEGLREIALPLPLGRIGIHLNLGDHATEAAKKLASYIEANLLSNLSATLQG